MSIDALLTHFDRLIQTPEAVSRLRRFILDLAVRGKLVPQDPADEPASELLKRIAAEKARLVKAGGIRKQRDFGSSEVLVPPFEVPASWCWVGLNAVGAITGGGTPSASDAENFADPGTGIPWLTPADLGGFSGLFISRGARDLSEKGFQTSSANLMPAGTVLFTSRAPIGYIAIAANPISTNQGFKSIVPYILNCSRFIALAMKTFAPEINARAPGTTFKEVSGKILAGVPFPLPPLAEQRRIVAKVDELMGLCDRLEAAQAERETTRSRLATASLARLNAPDTDPATFRQHVAFALDNFTPLTTRPGQVKALRQTILNLAVRGKLVPQDPGDEPAAELLKRIAAEKAHRKKKGQTGKEAEGSEGLDDLPTNWSLVPLITLGSWAIGSGFPKSEQGVTDGRYFFLKVSDMNLPGNEKYVTVANNYIDEAAATRIRAKIHPPGTIIFPKIGGAIATNKRRILTGEAAIDNNCLGITLSKAVNIEWAYLLLSALDFTQYQAGTAVPALQQGRLGKIPVMLPPLTEQRRIVAKVDELMGLCDRLEGSIAAGEGAGGRLVNAVLYEALEPHRNHTQLAVN